MRKGKGEIWRFIPSGDLFYVQKRGGKYYMSLKVISPPDADRIIRGETLPPRLERQVSSIGAFETVPEEVFTSL
jgi:hypothetical protein